MLQVDLNDPGPHWLRGDSKKDRVTEIAKRRREMMERIKQSQRERKSKRGNGDTKK